MMAAGNNHTTGNTRIGTMFYAAVSFGFVLAFGTIIYNKGVKSCDNPTSNIGVYIFATHALELLLSSIIGFLIKKFKLKLTKCLRIFAGLWGIYIFTLFIMAQVYLFSSENDCRTG